MNKIIIGLLSFIVGINAAVPAMAMDKIEAVETFSSKNTAENRVWVGTFQLVWNDVVDNIVKGPVKFISGDQSIAKRLNKKEFKADMLSEDSYYTAYGKTTPELKKQIEDAIMEKFGEKSDVLDRINWKNPYRAFVVYAMLKKDFEFLSKFSELTPGDFGPYTSDYFGINENSRAQLYNNVRVLFYNSPSDFAVALNTRTKDQVYIYRTNENKPFNTIYKKMNKETEKYKGDHHFVKGDKIKIPYISFKKDVNYDSLCGREIKNTDRLYFEKALQTVDFDLNDSGVKLKSEAAVEICYMSAFVPQPPKEGRNMAVNNTFYIFLKESNKELPYFAARIKDLILFKPAGK